MSNRIQLHPMHRNLQNPYTRSFLSCAKSPYMASRGVFCESLLARSILCVHRTFCQQSFSKLGGTPHKLLEPTRTRVLGLFPCCLIVNKPMLNESRLKLGMGSNIKPGRSGGEYHVRFKTFTNSHLEMNTKIYPKRHPVVQHSWTNALFGESATTTPIFRCHCTNPLHTIPFPFLYFFVNTQE